MRELGREHQTLLRGTAGALVHADQAAGLCPVCDGPMHVQKTFEHGGATLEHGTFRVRETVHVCAAGCTRPARPEAADVDVPQVAVIRRQPELAALLLPRSTVGYDVLCFVGRQRLVEYQQREVIQDLLRQDYGLELSTGEISDLCRRFVVYLQALHDVRSGALRAALEQDGGWPLHIDATGENGQGTLFCAYAGWRGWALGAWKIPTERADVILPKLQALVARFGPPCAVMRDLGKAVTEAARDLVAGLGLPIPVLGCHQHFLADVGKDLQRASHDELRDLFRRFKLLPRLRALSRDLGRSVGTEIGIARQAVTDWLGGKDERFLLPGGNAGRAVVRAVAQWVLDYAHDGTDAGFPFDRPYLDLYRRCRHAGRAVESLLWKPPEDTRVHGMLERLFRVLEPACKDLPFETPARVLEQRARLFEELREALRLVPKPARPSAQSKPSEPQKAQELRDIQKALAELEASLQARRPRRGPAQDQRRAIDLVIAHLERHGPSLSGHVIELPDSAGGGIRTVERTNVRLEQLWHEMKHGERQRSGRKVLSQDFEHLPAQAVLARNLTRPDYVAILCEGGTLDDLPRAFASLDAADRSCSLFARATASAARAGATEISSSSLEKADRDLVRTHAMKSRLDSEVRSRRPHWHKEEVA